MEKRTGTAEFHAPVGSARISTADQSPAPQIDALRAAGCGEISEDCVSGAKTDRPGLNEALGHLRSGDTLTVWRLDRPGRGIGFRSLTEGADTATGGGTPVFHPFGAPARFERDLIRGRTRAGPGAAAARGRKGGRRAVVTAEKLERAEMPIGKGLTILEAAARMKVGKTALYDAINADTSRNARPIRRPANPKGPKTRTLPWDLAYLYADRPNHDGCNIITGFPVG